MRVRIVHGVSGTRDGVEWPPPGSVVDVPADEGVGLCAAGIAVPVADDPEDKVERAVAPPAETRSPQAGRTSTRV